MLSVVICLFLLAPQLQRLQLATLHIIQSSVYRHVDTIDERGACEYKSFYYYMEKEKKKKERMKDGTATRFEGSRGCCVRYSITSGISSASKLYAKCTRVGHLPSVALPLQPE